MEQQSQQQTIEQLGINYDRCIEQVNQIHLLLASIAKQHDLQNLQAAAIEEEYLDLLANCLYAVNSLAFCSSQLKGEPMPAQFGKVKEYYMKAKNALAGVAEDIKVKKNVNPVIINQEAVKRLINHVLK